MKSASVTIQMKASEQYFPVVLFIIIMLYKVVLSFESVDEILKCDIQMKAIEQTTFLQCCLLCCTRWFYLLSLWMKSSSVTIQMNAFE